MRVHISILCSAGGCQLGGGVFLRCGFDSRHLSLGSFLEGKVPRGTLLVGLVMSWALPGKPLLPAFEA